MQQEEEQQRQQQILHEELQGTWQWRINTDPELAAALGLLSKRTVDDNNTNHALDPRSIDSFEQRLVYIQTALHRINSRVDRNQLVDANDKLSYDMYKEQLNNYITLTPKYKTCLCCVNRLDGPHVDLPLMAQYIPLNTTTQRLFYLQFLKAIPNQINEIIQLLQIGLVENRTPPQISFDGVIEQINNMIDNNLQSIREPIMKDNIFPDTEHDILSLCLQQIDGPIHTAFVSYVEYLQYQYIPNVRTEISATRGYPDGISYYQDCIDFHTGTSSSSSSTSTKWKPDDIHQIGTNELKRVREKMEQIASEQGYDGRLKDYLNELRTSPKYTPTSSEMFVSLFRNITSQISPKLLQLFHLKTLPRMPFDIVETPIDKATSAPAAYYLTGSIGDDDDTDVDNNRSSSTGNSSIRSHSTSEPSRPGMFYVNTSNLSSRRTYECISLALHESIPGHHIQGSIQLENISLPQFRSKQEDRRYFEVPCRFPFYTSYIEGWALHCETTLGYEMNMYITPEEVMGQLSLEAFRCCRLIIDTGIHSLDWTYEQSIQFMIDNTAMNVYDVTNEVIRYITWPGQALAYKMGEIQLRTLRQTAETKLGPLLFDKRDFYDIILKLGPVPFYVLEELVNEYIDRRTNINNNSETEENTGNTNPNKDQQSDDDDDDYVFV